MTPGRARLLDVDPDLGAALDQSRFELARARCTAERVIPDRIPWPSAREVGEGTDEIGYLVVRGALLQRSHLAGRTTVDLFGPGEVTRPWGPVDDFAELLSPSRWERLDDVELMRLDRVFLEQIALWPEVMGALAERTARHTRSLLMRLAVAQMPRLDARLRTVLWDLADRFGRVSPAGVLLPLRLRHDVIAGLVSASREAVSRSLASLERRRVVVRDPRGWRLLEGPPPQVFAFEETHSATGRALRSDRASSD